MVSGAETRPSASSAPPAGLRRRAAAAVSLLALTASLCFFLHNCWTFRELKIDDAYITYRFGARLVDDATLRWNLAPVPEDASGAQREAARPVEGYTSFLAVLISAAFEGLGLDPLSAWKILGLLAVLAGAAAAAGGAKALCGAWSPLAAGVPAVAGGGLPFLVAALYLAPPAGAVHAMSGMETALFASLLTVLTALAFQVVFSPRGGARWRLRLLALGFLLLGLTRPEGVLWAAVAGAGVGWALPRERRRPYLRALLFLFVLPGLAYFIARWVYFGDFLPTTFHAKAGGPTKPGAGRLLTYLPSKHEVYKYGRDVWLPLTAFAAAAWGAAVWLKTRPGEGPSEPNGEARAPAAFGLRDPATRVLLPAFAASALCIACFAHMHLLMGYAHRFFYPFGQTFWLTVAAPGLAAAGCVASAAAGGGEAEALRIGRRRAAVVLTGVIALLFAAALLRTARPGLREADSYAALVRGNHRSNDMYFRVGRTLESVARDAGQRRPRRLTLYHHNMGELLYCAPHWDSIDPVGLLDRRVSREGFSADYVFDREPDLLFLPSKRQDMVSVYRGEFVPDVSRVLFVDSRMGGYVYLGCLTSPYEADGWGGHFFVRRALIEAHPWVGPRLLEELGLRVDPAFPQAERRRAPS